MSSIDTAGDEAAGIGTEDMAQAQSARNSVEVMQ